MATLDDLSMERFRKALRIRTDWPTDAPADSPEAARAVASLAEFQDFLAAAYPAFHSAAERTVLSPFALVYRWPAAAPAAGADTRKPALLMAHYDVVPAETERWTVDPFAGEVADGYVYGRGTIDTKNSLIATLEAAESLAAAGFSPKDDVYFAFGGDEERTGTNGAKRSAAYFAEKGISFSWALDEGSAVVQGMLGGIPDPIALIGVEEKGFLDVELSVTQSPGHSSRPPRVQAVAVLGAALARLSERPFPYALTDTVECFFRNLARLSSPFRAAVLRNARRLGPLFFRLAAGTPETEALLRTTLAMTQLSGSPADNVLPSEAKAVLNIRLLPGWDVARAVAYVRKAVADDRVSVSVSAARGANDAITASPEVAAGRGPGWKEIAACVGAAFPSAAIMPFLVTATTDSRHYASLCDAIYRFVPISLTGPEIARMHGHDERISIDNFAASIGFYRSLIAEL